LGKIKKPRLVGAWIKVEPQDYDESRGGCSGGGLALQLHHLPTLGGGGSVKIQLEEVGFLIGDLTHLTLLEEEEVSLGPGGLPPATPQEGSFLGRIGFYTNPYKLL
jgi:hypothetical protein